MISNYKEYYTRHIKFVYKKMFLLWKKMIRYPIKIRSHLVTIVPMEPFTPKSTLKLRSDLPVRNSIVIPFFIPYR